MATTYKVLGQSAPSATTATALYTVPAATSAVVSTINVCNRSASSVDFRVAVRPAGAALASQHYLCYDIAVPGKDSIALTLGVSLAATDVLEVYAGDGNLSFTAFGAELS